VLAEKLREIRKKKKVTQDSIAAHLGILRQSYSAYERGVSMPDARQLKRLADFFGVSTDYFFGGANPALHSAQNEREQRLLAVARKAERIPPGLLDRLIANFEANIDIYLEHMGFERSR
jgi:transcriptional regulator with XRE-family HTH domain